MDAPVARSAAASARAAPARRSSRSTAAACASASRSCAAASASVERTRGLHRAERARACRIPTVALVGYTNAGKSTLMNALTRAGVLVEDQLFATLDPTVRRLRLPEGLTVLLADTVGFIHKLPHQLVEAFKSTLEEVRTADLLLHVVDASHPALARSRSRVVEEVLAEIGAGDGPGRRACSTRSTCCRRGAAAGGAARTRSRSRRARARASRRSSRAIEDALDAGLERVRCALPSARGDVIAWLRRSRADRRGVLPRRHRHRDGARAAEGRGAAPQGAPRQHARSVPC